MGWDSDSRWINKKDVINDLNKINSPNKLLGHHSTHGMLWQLIEYTSPSNIITNIIVCNLIEKRNGKYWVKSISEIEHPYYYSCSLDFLAQAPTTNKEWRQNVIAYWVKAKTKYAIGSRLLLSNDWKVSIIGLKPLAGMRYDIKDNSIYRIPKKMIISEVVE